VAQDNMVAPIRCTQNPTQGEEWKQGWHPEEIEAAASEDQVLVIGAGPAGLEATLQLANRGYQVTLAEASDALGGRVSRESELPGMASYVRVRDYRENQIRQKPNVEIYLGNQLSANDVIELQIPHVLIATGAHWHRDGTGRQHAFPIAGLENVSALTPDDVLAGVEISGRVLIYDDDHYFMGSTIAERCRNQGHDVCLVTPQSQVSSWTNYTLEQEKIQARLLTLGVEIVVSHELLEVEAGQATIANIYSQEHQQQLDFETLIMVTSRQSDDGLYQALLEHEDRFKTLRAIGDCNAPGTVAAAVYDGHSAARYLESDQDIYAPLFAREMPTLD
jgi:dimethylamine/trimethylamine dehydrogenase